MSEEKKELKDEELDKVSGGWSAEDTAKFGTLNKLWQRVQILVDGNLKNAKASGDPVAIQKAQELYNAVVNEKNLRELHDLKWDYSNSVYINPENEKQLDDFWNSFDYEHYMDWLNGIATDLLGK